MKRIISTILILSFAFMMISCTSNVINETVPEGTNNSINETREVDSELNNSEIGMDVSQDTIIGGSRRCKVHCWGYHEVLFDVASLLISEKEADDTAAGADARRISAGRGL